MPPSSPSMLTPKMPPRSKTRNTVSSSMPMAASNTPPEPQCHTSRTSYDIEKQHQRYHPTFSHHYHMRRILAFLPKSSLLNFRLADSACRRLVSTASPSIFSNLNIQFPISSLPEFQNAARQCRHLTVAFIPPTQLPTIPTSLSTATLPPLPTLTHLHLTPPPTSTFSTHLTFRLALQMAHAPHLTHLSIANTTIDSILALRWGGFTSFAYPGLRRGEVWRGLKDLEVSILPWWDQSDSQSEKSARELRDEFRTGVRVLHDWLNTFATTGSLEVLRFGWEGCEGPNPLLLDEVVDGDRGRRWLDASEMMWEGLREVWLRGVHVDKGDVGLLKERVNGLERLMVEAGAEGETVRGRRVVEEGGEWFEVLLGDEEGLGAVDGGGEVAVEEGELGLETSEVDDLMGLLDVAVMNCLEKEGLLETSIGTLP